MLIWMVFRGFGSVYILGYLIERCKKGSSIWIVVND